MDAEMVNTFVESAQSVLQTEVGSPVQMGQLSVQTAAYTSQQITTLIGMTGSIRGVVMLGLSEETAKLAVSRMMGQDFKTLDELAQSGIAEMGNVIAGTAATGLAAKGHSCMISPPILIFGSGTIISTMNTPRLVIPLLTPCGLIEMQLALKANVAQRQPVASVGYSAG